MDKAVLLSIQPKWCEKIINGEKTVEVRKTYPKQLSENMETPFKCYIYCTKPKFQHEDHMVLFEEGRAFYAGGKVIGEFVCNVIGEYWFTEADDDIEEYEDVQLSCLSAKQILDYGGGKSLYFWNISSLRIYEDPLELDEFMKPCSNSLYCEACAMYSEFAERCLNTALTILRPPQSWCYVEEIEL